ncbi:probable serine hydrolase [Chelonus insularis]|uniref:probable serine hydrolase n=1 Tax=Chelonus insularis TaxID=460826 RepID=UPI001588886C|nr:probable serine hydrolase [Chelonus insularis]XP_034952047.1 probable serine hydrolase [Chelonus insularis]
MFLKYCRYTVQKLSKLKTISSVRNVGSEATNNGKFEEVEIKVPWGKICGKYWGPQDVQPIIAIHGGRDNACSFDPIAIRLPENVSLFAVDLPGHGLSSWIPRGMQYTALFIVQIFDRVREHFKINKLKLMGHSLGGITSFLYTSIYPNDVKYIVALDNYKPITYIASALLPMSLRYREAFFKNEKSPDPPAKYSYENAIKKMIAISKNSLDVATSQILMERGMTKKPDGSLYFNEDPRVKFLPFDLSSTVDQMKIFAKQFHCPFLFIKGDQFNRIDNMERYYEVLEVIEKHSEDFQHHSVAGTHHFHMGNPKKVAAIINPFILKHVD